MSLNSAEAIVQTYRLLSELVPQTWASGAVQTDDGARIRYTRTGGDKPALLLLHGLQTMGLMWLRTAQALESDYDVIMPDFRAHGQSDAGKEISAQRLVDDTLTLMTALSLEHPFIAGHSMGADIAGRVAATRPVRAVVLVDPALSNFLAAMQLADGPPPPWMQAIFDTMSALREQPHQQRMVTALRLMMPGAPLYDEVDYVPFAEAHARFDVSFYRVMHDMDYLFESPNVIARVTAPLLVMTAQHGMPGTDINSAVSVFTDHAPQAEHVHFSDSGHFIMYDQFDRFISVLTAFLRAY